MKGSSYKHYDDLPLFLNAELVAKVLGVSPSSAYELMHEDGFPVLRVGSRMVVPKEQFIQWVQDHTGGNASGTAIVGIFSLYPMRYSSLRGAKRKAGKNQTPPLPVVRRALWAVTSNRLGRAILPIPRVGQAERLACRKRRQTHFCGQEPAPTSRPVGRRAEEKKASGPSNLAPV